MEERRLLLAVALSLLVLTAYQLLFPPPPRPAPSAAVPSPAKAAARLEQPSPSPSAPTKPSPAPTPRAAIADSAERRIEIEGQDVSVALTNRGARLLAWRLPAYRDSRGRPEDMVQTTPGGPRPLDLETGDAEVDARLREALFVASSERLDLRAGERRLRLEFADEELVAHKILEFEPRGFLIGVEAHVRRRGQELPVRISWGPGLANPSAAERELRGYQGPQAVAFVRGALQHTPTAKLEAPQTLSDAAFLGIESHYFAALWLPSKGTVSGQFRALTLPTYEDGSPHVAPESLLSLSETGGRALLYVGPKDYHILAEVGHDLARVVPIGDWIGPLVVPLMGLLRWVHAFVGNYGWSIVVLTVLINVVMGPLRHYSIRNGIKMAKLSPEMRVIQERYRKVPALDARRQQMQQEIQELYAKHGMSMGTQMAVGCVPILLTMPFLFAFYRVLDVSIDLRGAEFLWIGDLSQKDPLFITPLLMGVSMFVMQRMTPSTMDPSQQRIMMLMPLILVGMFFWAPAGLNLYWLASNVCSIAQQGLTQRLLRREQKAGVKEKRR